MIGPPAAVRHEEMLLNPSIEPCPSGDVARLWPLLRDAEAADARMIAALIGSAAVAYIARSDGDDLKAHPHRPAPSCALRGARTVRIMALLRCAASLSLARSSINILIRFRRFGSSTAPASKFR